MVKRKNDRNQSKLGIVTLDSNIPKDHISRFVVDFIALFLMMLNHQNAQFKDIEENMAVILKY